MTTEREKENQTLEQAIEQYIKNLLSHYDDTCELGEIAYELQEVLDGRIVR